MPRPVKNYCDYFPHDRDMRNHRKVKAIRTKFGIEGYALWSMILEYLTGIDGNVFEYSEAEFELIGGDFGVSVETIRDVVGYCIKLEMLFIKEAFISSESLDERLKPVYDKRGKSKDNSKKQQRSNGKFIGNNTASNGISVAEIPQTKVNRSKVNKSIDIPSKEDFLKYCQERCAMVGYTYKQYEAEASTKYDAWVANGWFDLKGNKIDKWKGKIVANIQYWKVQLNGHSSAIKNGITEVSKDTDYSNVEI